jgi:hypothetical protein
MELERLKKVGPHDVMMSTPPVAPSNDPIQ